MFKVKTDMNGKIKDLQWKNENVQGVLYDTEKY